MPHSRQAEIDAAKEEMEASVKGGIRETVICHGVKGNHEESETCWCCPEIIRFEYGTIVLHHNKPM